MKNINEQLILDEDFKNVNIHQAILNVGYDWWQNDGKGKSYGDMIDYMKNEYGNIYALAILLGKYSQQVGNGGHIQYYDNGYADGNGGCFSEHDIDIPLHKEMIELYIKEGIQDKIKNGNEVLDILKSFKIELDPEEYITESCDDCDGCGEIEIEDAKEDEDDMKECSSCNGSGECEIHNDDYNSIDNTYFLSSLDDRLYLFDAEMMESFNEYLKKSFEFNGAFANYEETFANINVI